MGKIFQETETTLQQMLHEKEAALETLGAEQVERQATSTKTEATLKEARETVFAQAEKLRKDTGALKKADEDLEQANISLDAIDAKLTIAEEKRARLTDVMAQSFPLLKDGSVEIQVDVKRLLDVLLSFAKDLDFETSLLASIPAALSQTCGKRTPSESLILQQFEAAMLVRLAKLDEEIRSLASAKIEVTNKVDNAIVLVDLAQETFKASLAALSQAQVAQAMYENAVHKVKSGLLEHAVLLTACKSARRELIAFQTGPLTAFHELEKRVTPIEGSANEVHETIVSLVAAGSAIGLTETMEAHKPDSHKVNDENVCPNVGVVEKAEAQKLKKPIRRDNLEVQSSKEIRRLENTSQQKSDQSILAMAGA